MGVHTLRETKVAKSLAPEHLPILDLLIAARAHVFVGNAISTLSTNVLMERDVRGLPRNSTFFCGLGSHEEWSGGHTLYEESAGSSWLPLSQEAASQSSTAFSGDAANAIDGTADPIYFHGHCTHTETQHSPWWKVDLGGQHTIRRVRVLNRGDCCSDRLKG